MRMRKDYTLDNASIVLSLLRAGHTHRCERCQKGMLVRKASGLCVECFNLQLRTTPLLSHSVAKRTTESPAELRPAPAAC